MYRVLSLIFFPGATMYLYYYNELLRVLLHIISRGELLLFF